MPHEPPGAGSPVPSSPSGAGRGDAEPPGRDEPGRPRFAPGAERAGDGAPRSTGPAGAGTRTALPAPGPAERRAESEPSGVGSDGRRAQAAGGRQPRRVRKVRRVVRHVDPWSVLKVSVLFFLVLFLIFAVAAAVLWAVGRQTGAIENVEDFITDLGVFGNCEPIEDAPVGAVTTTVPAEAEQVLPDPGVDDLSDRDETVVRDENDCVVGEQVFVGSFRFEGDELFQAFVVGGLVLVIAGAAGSVVLAVLFNLISDLTGGVRVTVLEEQPVTAASRTAPTGSPPPRGGG